MERGSEWFYTDADADTGMMCIVDCFLSSKRDVWFLRALGDSSVSPFFFVFAFLERILLMRFENIKRCV